MLLGFFVILFIFSCGKNPAEKARDIVIAAIEEHGGLENWQSLKELSFVKTTTLFNEDGSVESKTTQNQSFNFKPRKIFKIGYVQDSAVISIISDEGFIHKRRNGYVVNDEDEIEQAGNAIKAALYVVSQPFELLNEDSQITWAGTEMIDETPLEVIEVTYSGDGPGSDKWSYYIHPQTNTVMANKVVLTDHASWVENLTFDENTGFKFNAHRKSYRLNEKGEKTYLRAEYFYEDFQVRY